MPPPPPRGEGPWPQARIEIDSAARNWPRLPALPGEQIDTLDIPELTDEQLSRAVRGERYRPVKKPMTMRLDVDGIHWLKSQGPG
jgi:uncharacterized protein (DUF4415 family)